MKYSIIIALILLNSCSTLKRSKFVGALTGALTCGVLGSYLGKELSPDKESESFNRVLGTGSGAALCGLGGYYLGASLYENDPRNMEDEPIHFNDKNITPTSSQQMLPPNFTNITFEDLKHKTYGEESIQLIKDIPNSLKEKIPRQKITKYKVDPQTIKKDGKTIYFSGGEAIEHEYIEK